MDNMQTRFESKIFVRGIFGRNRKEKFEIFTLATSLENKPEEKAVYFDAMKKFREIKLREGKFSVKIQQYQEKKDNDMVMRTIIPDNEILVTHGQCENGELIMAPLNA